MPSRPASYRPPHLSRSTPSPVAAALRGTARERGYTAAWDRAAKVFKAEHPLCLGCEAVGETAATEVVDHIEPHRGDKVKFWDQTRWQPACRFHHDVVKQRLEQRFLAGHCSVADLRLDSEAAKALTRALMGGGSNL